MFDGGLDAPLPDDDEDDEEEDAIVESTRQACQVCDSICFVFYTVGTLSYHPILYFILYTGDAGPSYKDKVSSPSLR